MSFAEPKKDWRARNFDSINVSPQENFDSCFAHHTSWSHHRGLDNYIGPSGHPSDPLTMILTTIAVISLYSAYKNREDVRNLLQACTCPATPEESELLLQESSCDEHSLALEESSIAPSSTVMMPPARNVTIRFVGSSPGKLKPKLQQNSLRREEVRQPMKQLHLAPPRVNSRLQSFQSRVSSGSS